MSDETVSNAELVDELWLHLADADPRQAIVLSGQLVVRFDAEDDRDQAFWLGEVLSLVAEHFAWPGGTGLKRVRNIVGLSTLTVIDHARVTANSQPRSPGRRRGGLSDRCMTREVPRLYTRIVHALWLSDRLIERFTADPDLRAGRLIARAHVTRSGSLLSLGRYSSGSRALWALDFIEPASIIAAIDAAEPRSDGTYGLPDLMLAVRYFLDDQLLSEETRAKQLEILRYGDGGGLARLALLGRSRGKEARARSST
jgi:hypothetical protein